MTPDEIRTAISSSLEILGTPVEESTSLFDDPRFSQVAWSPTYVWRVDDKIWAIELYRGDIVPEHTVQEMIKMRGIEPAVQPAFFIPEGQGFDHLIRICSANSIALIAKPADEYEAEVPQSAIQPVAVVRVQEWILQGLTNLPNIQPAFRGVLRHFRRRFLSAVAAGANDDVQQSLIRECIVNLIRRNDRLTGGVAPLEFLRFLEQNLPGKGRDHFFHTFNLLLIGCIVIDRAYEAFHRYRQLCCLPNDWSIEYTWLLTVLFHDVGYPIQRYGDTIELVLGVTALTPDEIIAGLRRAWDLPTFRSARAQLVALYEYLTQPSITNAWSVDPFPQEAHRLDLAFEGAFLSKAHGLASCMRMLADFYKSVPASFAHHQYLTRHVFVAGLSIPFHDWPVRQSLRENGIGNISTSRFPFAALLMFLDSIQEDRRGMVQEPDILIGVNVNGTNVSAELDLEKLTPARLEQKQREARDVKGFLVEDDLVFVYPQALMI